MNGCIVNTQSDGPLIDRQSFTVECQAMVHPAIVHLLKLSSPAAVARLIVAIIVDAIKGVLLAGPRPHVVKEVLEGALSLIHISSTGCGSGRTGRRYAET